MKPRITFQHGPRVIIANSREFGELPPINQELELRDARYKVVGYESATVIIEPIPDAPEQSPKKSPKAKRIARKQAKAQRKEVRAATGKPAVKSDMKAPAAHNRR